MSKNEQYYRQPKPPLPHIARINGQWGVRYTRGKYYPNGERAMKWCLDQHPHVAGHVSESRY